MVAFTRQFFRWGLLTTSLVLIVGTVLIFQIMVLAISRDRALQQIAVRAANRAQANTHQLQALLKQADMLLLDVRGHLDAEEIIRGIATSSPERYRQMRLIIGERLARLPELMVLNVMTLDGRCIFSSCQECPTMAIADQDYFSQQKHSLNDRLIISDIFFTRTSQQWTIVPSRRITTSDGRFCGVVLVTINSTLLSSMMQAVDRDKWIFGVVNQDLRVLARRPEMPDLTGKILSDSDFFKWIKNPVGYFNGPGMREADPHVWGVSSLNEVPLTVVAGYRVAAALEQWHQDVKVHLFFAATLISSGIYLIFMQGKRSRAALAAMELDRRLRTSEKTLDDLIRIVPVGVFRLSLNTEGWFGFGFASQRCQDILGRDPASCLTATGFVKGLIQAEDCEELTGIVKKSMAHHEEFKWSGRIIREQAIRWLHVQAVPVMHEGRREWAGILQDITEKKHLEDQLRQSEKMQAVGMLAGGIAHDFNNILSCIIGYCELAIRRHGIGNDAKISAYLSQIEIAAERAKTLVHQILAFSRRDPGELLPSHLQSSMREVMGLLRATIPSTIEIAVSAAEDVGPVRANSGRMHQLLMNICGNAVQAMAGKGTLTIVLDQCDIDHPLIGLLGEIALGTYARIEISDTGVGMSAETMGKIFDPFFTTKDASEGTGLGLAVAWNVIETHGGNMQVESAVGVGTTFRIFFPVISQRPSPMMEKNMLVLPHGSEHILVVDDEPRLVDILCESLSGLGYRVHGCANGQEALCTLRQHPHTYQMLITDQTMSGMTGVELIKQALGLSPHLSIILCSGYSKDIDSEKTAKSLGAHHYCTKPVDLDELACVIRGVLDQRGQRGPQMIDQMAKDILTSNVPLADCRT